MAVDNRQKTAYTLNKFFILTFAFSWFFWFYAVLSSRGVASLPLPELTWVVLGAHGPLAASLWLTYRTYGLPGVKRLLAAGFMLRIKLAWWIAILAFPIIMAGIAYWISISIGDFRPDTVLLSQPLLIIPNLFFMFFLGGSVQEEFGWRGFALPRLLVMQSPFTASLMLGVVWGFWHLPLFFVLGLSQSYMNFGIFLFLTLAFSFFFTWLYIRTDNNLFSALLLHTAINTSLNIFPPMEQISGGSQAAFAYLTVIYLAAAGILIIRERSFWFHITISRMPQGQYGDRSE